MSVPFLLAMHGDLVIEGSRPDGDSMRFVPADPAQLRRLERADRIDVSRNGSVQLRFEAIDAPETHYGTLAQPLGHAARDKLVQLAGFSDVDYTRDGTVTAATPARVKATVLSKRAEANGRPVAYVIIGAEPALADGTWIHVDEPLLRRTLNASLLDDGSAYLTLYTSTPAEHASVFRVMSAAARQASKGVWALDSTREFRLVNQESIGPEGQLILPKLFRRCSDYLKARAGGYRGTLADWLIDVSATGRRPEDDKLITAGHTEVRLSAVLQQRNDRVRFPVDLLDLVFVER